MKLQINYSNYCPSLGSTFSRLLEFSEKHRKKFGRLPSTNRPRFRTYQFWRALAIAYAGDNESFQMSVA